MLDVTLSLLPFVCEIFVIVNVPIFPWSTDKFQTPLILLISSSFSNKTSWLLRRILPRNFNSRYKDEESYIFTTFCIVLKIFGSLSSADVKINSNFMLLQIKYRHLETKLRLIIVWVIMSLPYQIIQTYPILDLFRHSSNFILNILYLY